MLAHWKSVLFPASLVLALLTGCQSGDDPAEPAYRAELVRTTHGVAHITAEDYGSLGYGEGYAAAEDHLCNIARGLLEGRGELARHLGPDDGGGYPLAPRTENANLVSDLIVRAMDIAGQARTALASQAPEDREWLAGYTAGYNRFVREQGASQSSWCAGADWVRPVEPVDFMARMVMVAQTAPRMAGAVAAAQPPAQEAQDAALQVSESLIARAAAAVGLDGFGSNAWAFGRARSENGRGLLLGNPHYPWYGDYRFWEKHLTIPGELDVYGAHLLGAPGVAIGFNDAVAWSHTVSASERVVFYRLKLVPDDPTTYYYDGEPRRMRAQAVSVAVLQDDGSVAMQEHTVWFSHYGPMVSLPGMAWDRNTAFTLRDANAGNYSLLAQWKAMNRARDLDEFIDAHRRYNALPWVNTIAASADGEALYLDNSTVGDLTEEAIAAWRDSLATDRQVAGMYAGQGWVLLDGSDSRFEWRDDNGAPLPGTVPFEQRPLLRRHDYVFNSNDSYWLSNPDAPMSGYSPLYGTTETARSLRTRMNLLLLAAEDPYGHAGEGARFNRREITEALFSNRSLAADLLLEPLIAACKASPKIDVGTESIDLTAACSALSQYDGHLDEDSAGAVLFREWLAQYPVAETTRAGKLFAQPFDDSDPLNTPSGLADPDLALQRLAAALAVLGRAGLPADAPLGSAQFAYRGGEPIPVHGGNSREGVANLQVAAVPRHPVAGVSATPVEGSPTLTTAGYPIVHGSSFILLVAFTNDGPAAEALLTYGQSGDPGSAHFVDQTRLYRAKRLRPVLFERPAIEAHAVSRRTLTGPR